MTTAEIKESLKNWPLLVKKYQKSNLNKATIQILNSFLPFLGILITAYWLYDYSKIAAIALALICSLFLIRIFIIQHDCGHQSFFKNKKLNNIWGQICSIFSIMPYKHWSTEHNYHHAHTGDLDFREMGDIPLYTVKEYQALTPFKQKIYKFFIRSYFSVLVISPLYYLFISNRIGYGNRKNWKKYIKGLLFHNAMLLLVFAILVYTFGFGKVITLHLSVLIPFAILAYLVFFVQHQHEEGYKQWKEQWEYLLAAIKGSTFLKLPRILQWFTGNIGFHHIHHLSSLIPNYNLELCNKENPLFEKFAVKIGLKDIPKMISNKLWDEKLQKMITWSEYKKLYGKASA